MPQVFQLFRRYITSVSSRCCKSRSGVAHVATDLSVVAAGCYACEWEVKGDGPSGRLGTGHAVL
jgi:hypothetical protein